MSTFSQSTSNHHNKHLFVFLARVLSVLAFAALLNAFFSPMGRLDMRIPIGGLGGVSIGVNTNGTLSGAVGMGASKGGVSVGASTSGATQIDK